MKAIVRNGYGTVDELEIREIELPEPQPGDVLVKVMAFGLNRAEIYMRQGLWGDVAAVSGIECVGSVVLDRTGKLKPGQKVAAIMGGRRMILKEFFNNIAEDLPVTGSLERQVCFGTSPSTCDGPIGSSGSGPAIR